MVTMIRGLAQVSCDNCPHALQTHELDPTMARAAARFCGWTVTLSFGDRCPRCINT